MPTFFKYNFSDCGGVMWERINQSVSSVRQESPTSDIKTMRKNAARGELTTDTNRFYLATQILTALIDASPDNKFVFDGSWFGHPGAHMFDTYAGNEEYRFVF